MITRMSRREIYRNRWIRVFEDDVRFADGSDGIYGVVEKPDFAVIVPRHGDGRLQMVELFRYAVGGRYWEFPQGAWEGNEAIDPGALAARELSEETGFRAGRLESLGFFHGAYGFSDMGGHAFLATDLQPGEPSRDAGEAGMETAAFTRAEIGEMIRSGRITDAATLAVLALYDLSGL